MPLAENAKHLDVLTIVELANNNLAVGGPQFIPELLTALPRLRYLDVSKNQLKGLPEPSLWKGTGLRTLLASHNEISALQLGTNASQHWPNIDRINLSHNALQEIPKDIDELATLTSLNFEFNKDITTLPIGLGNLRRLWDFPRKNLPGIDVEPALLHATTKELINYLYDKLNDSVKYYRIRMLVVGLADQGKTSLLRHLTNHQPLPQEQRFLGTLARVTSPRRASSSIKKPLSTVGVNVSEWKVLRRLGRERERYTISCWDFAGQEVSLSQTCAFQFLFCSPFKTSGNLLGMRCFVYSLFINGMCLPKRGKFKHRLQLQTVLCQALKLYAKIISPSLLQFRCFLRVSSDDRL